MLANNKIVIREVRQINELEKHEKSWNKLLKKCPDSTPTQTFAWIYAYFKYKLRSDTKWICLFAYNLSDELLGVYPLIVLGKLGIPGLKVQFFTMPYDIFHTVRTDGLINPDHQEIITTFLDFLKRRFKAHPTIKIQRIPQISPTLRCLEDKRFNFFHYKKLVTFEDYVNTDYDFQGYEQSLNSKFRRELKRQERRLNEKVKLVYAIDERERENNENLYHFTELENSGWKAIKGTSIKKIPGDFPLFSCATEHFNKNGWMRWHFIEADSIIIGALLTVKINKVNYCWKIAYNESFSYGSPGHLLVKKVLEKAFDEEKSFEVNFMNKRKWLKPWNVKKRALFNVYVFPQLRLIAFLGKLILKFHYFRNPPNPLDLK